MHYTWTNTVNSGVTSIGMTFNSTAMIHRQYIILLLHILYTICHTEPNFMTDVSRQFVSRDIVQMGTQRQ